MNQDYWYKQIDEIMTEFDFLKVKRVMDFLDWKWQHKNGKMKVPSLKKIKKTARGHLVEAISRVAESPTNKGGCSSSGGFDARAYPSEGGWLELSFYITDWSSPCE